MVKDTFTAGAGGVTKGDVLRISAASTVLPVTATTHRVVGVADNTALVNQTVNVLVLGVVTLTADGAITAGDAIGPTTTSGRCVAANSVTPTFTGSALAAHDHVPTTNANIVAQTGTLNNDTDIWKGTQTGSATCAAGCNQNHPPNAGNVFATQVPDGSVAFTKATMVATVPTVSAGTPAGTVSAVSAGLVFGRAITAAAGAGSTFTALINCSGA